jgi:hypothetical protein
MANLHIVAKGNRSLTVLRKGTEYFSQWKNLSGTAAIVLFQHVYVVASVPLAA